MVFQVNKFSNWVELKTFLTTGGGSGATGIDAVFWDHGIVLVWH